MVDFACDVIAPAPPSEDGTSELSCAKSASTVDTTTSLNFSKQSKFKASSSTTSANDLLVAFIQADGPLLGAQTIKSVTGAGLTWTRVTRANSTQARPRCGRICTRKS
jgi:hypothetical protein